MEPKQQKEEHTEMFDKEEFPLSTAHRRGNGGVHTEAELTVEMVENDTRTTTVSWDGTLVHWSKSRTTQMVLVARITVGERAVHIYVHLNNVRYIA